VTTAAALPRGDTPLRNVRVDDPLWEKAKTETRLRGTNPSEVMREALARYVDHGNTWVAIDAETWTALAVAAEAYGTDPWEVISKAIASYVKRHPVEPVDE
jgi:predicted transcriptional regulator